MITVEIDDRAVREALGRLEELAGQLRPVLATIGEILAESTKARFRAGVGPDGTSWAPNRPSTIEAMLRRRMGSTVRREGERVGAPSAKALGAAAAGKRPLVGESRRLSSEIAWEVGPDRVSVGSGLVYAAVQQLGARRGAFGATRRGAPIPWGDIPPRPFLGLSAEDEQSVLATVAEALKAAVG